RISVRHEFAQQPTLATVNRSTLPWSWSVRPQFSAAVLTEARLSITPAATCRQTPATITRVHPPRRCAMSNPTRLAGGALAIVAMALIPEAARSQGAPECEGEQSCVAVTNLVAKVNDFRTSTV